MSDDSLLHVLSEVVRGIPRSEVSLSLKSRASTLQVAAGYSNGKSTSTLTQQSTEQGKLAAVNTELTVQGRSPNRNMYRDYTCMYM